MTISGMLILIGLLGVVPIIIGSAFVTVDKKPQGLPFMWIFGQLVLWAGFQLLSVPIILKVGRFSQVVNIYSVYTAVMLVGAVILWCVRRKKTKLRPVKTKEEALNKTTLVAWIIFWALLVFQLIQAVRLAYGDGDDAFYVAISGMAEDSEWMYQKIAYTGWPSVLDVRHGMAPFPIWIAYLIRLSGMEVSTVNHIVMPLMLIPMTYAIYYLLAEKLFSKKKEGIPVFLIITELLVLFGDYSYYTAERFMIARSRQGKAALGSVIIPVLFFLLLLFLEKMQENQRISLGYWILLGATMTTGCLCSTLGALLVCVLIGVTGLCAAACYKKWKFLFPMATCCVPCVVYAGLYLILG